MAKKNQEFYVGISEPVNLRKTILEASRESIHLLQNYEKLRLIRKEKLELVHKLDSIMKELFTLSQRLKYQLPKVQSKKVKPEKKEEKAKPAPKKLKAPKQKSALEQLQSELDDIESQLSKLS